MNIDIFTCLTFNSGPYATHLKDNLESLKSNKNTIRYWSIGNEVLNSLPADGWVHLGNVRHQAPPSASHAAALNDIINHIPEDSDFVVIADCDIAILQKDWDELMIRFFRDVDIISTPKFCHVFSVYFTWFTAKSFRTIRPDFMPGNKTTVSVAWTTVKTKEESVIYQLPVGARIVQDTGWNVPRQIYKHGLKYKLLPYYQDNNNMYHLIFNYLLNDKLFVTHFSGSHKRGFDSPACIAWRNGVAEWIKTISR
ncbi:MAG: hypothetical protein PHT77_10960 [Bacteroidales bacterium]|jgi:hypothetical protein|nr:hypothetical protein [Bacteroidales bacterium]